MSEGFAAYDQAVNDRHRIQAAPKVCECCGNWFCPAEDERPAAFAARTRCSQRCSAARGKLPPYVPTVLGYAEIAKRLGMSRQNVQRIERVALEKLRAALEARGDEW